MQAAELRRRLEDSGVDTVVVGGADLNGIFRSKRVPAAVFVEDVWREGVGLSDFLFGIDLLDELVVPDAGYKGWMPSPARGFGNVLAVPDLDTLSVAPWLERTAVVIADWHHTDGTPVAVSPRGVLRRVVERYAALGLEPLVSVELEFHLFPKRMAELHAEDYRDLETSYVRASNYDNYLATLSEKVIGPMRRHATAFGIPVVATHTEGGAGQFEAPIAPAPPLRAADHAFLFKQLAKEVADEQGSAVSFIAKLDWSRFGSSAHIHQSLWRDGDNVFWDPEGADHSSAELRHFGGGQLATLREFTALYAPFVNSYRRFRPYSFGGTTVTWGFENRSTGLRVMGHTAGSRRIELRATGADCNPYVAVAAALAGGLHGLEGKVKAPAFLDDDAYASDAETIPSSLERALPLLEKSKLARELLGEGFVDYYCAFKRHELKYWEDTVTDWEIRRYLERA